MLLRFAPPAVACLVASLVAGSARAETPAPLAPTADVAAPSLAAPSQTRRKAGIALTAVGGAGLAAGSFLTWFAFSAGTSCTDGCPPAVSDGAKAGAIAGTIAAGGLLATGIVLVVTGARAEQREAERRGIRPTAQGVAFAF